jgi:hypothetical protein
MKKMKREEWKLAIMTVLAYGGMGEALVPTTGKNVGLLNNTDSGGLGRTIGLFFTYLRG